MGRGKREIITSRPYGKVQQVRSGRKLFGKERRAVFLERLTATCNVTLAAAAAGVTPQCVYQRRRRDAEFREAWGDAVELGYARLELRLLEAAMGRGGDWDDEGGDNGTPQGEREVGADPSTTFGGPPPPGKLGEDSFDKDLALHLLREHKRGGVGRKEGAPLRSAGWDEVAAYFTARLKALRVRIDGAGEDPSTIRSSADGSPPRGKLGEELS